jgi:hypothetical protein
LKEINKFYKKPPRKSPVVVVVAGTIVAVVGLPTVETSRMDK